MAGEQRKGYDEKRSLFIVEKFSSPVNRTPCTRFFSIEITMGLTSKNRVHSARTNEEETKQKRKEGKRKMMRRRKYENTREKEGEIWKVKLNFDEGRNAVCDNELLRTPRCLQMVAVVRGYWFFSAVFHPYRAISNRERQAQNRPCFFSPFRLCDSSYRSILSFGFSLHVSNARSRNVTLIVLLIRFVIRIARLFWETVEKGIISTSEILLLNLLFQLYTMNEKKKCDII